MDPGYQEYVLGNFPAHESQLFLDHHHHHHHHPSSSSTPVLPQLKDNSLDDFRLLPELPLQPSISAEAELLCCSSKENYDSFDKGKSRYVAEEEVQSQGVIMKPAKRSRSAEEHTISESRRRDRIKWRIRALQDLMPHSRKSDRASILEDAAEYIKALKLQLETMTTTTTTTQAPGECDSLCMSCGGPKPGMNSPKLSTYMPIRPAGAGIGIPGVPCPFGGGMVGLTCSAQYAPVFQLSSPGLGFSPSPGLAALPNFPSFPPGVWSSGPCKTFLATSQHNSKQETHPYGAQMMSAAAPGSSSGVEADHVPPKNGCWHLKANP